MSRGKYIGAGVGCAAIPLTVIVVLGMLMTNPFKLKTKVLTYPVKQVGSLSLGYVFDGDIGYEYFVRVKAVGSRYDDWTPVGWGLVSDSEPGKSFQAFSSKDGRFICIASKKWKGGVYRWARDGEVELIIYDSEEDVLWPSESSKKLSKRFWKDAVSTAVEDNR